jgi:hypothetical protein
MRTLAYRNTISVMYLAASVNTEHTIATCGQDAELSDVEPGGTYISYRIGKG